jgi:hypothetical protein
MKEAEAEELSTESSSDTPEGTQEANSEKSETSETSENSAAAAKSDAKKKEEELIDEAVSELKDKRIGTIRTVHDGLVQQGDVFTTSLGRTPGGRGRDRGVSRDAF